MSDRAVYVYRLVIVYPPGSDKPGWKPACWGQVLRSIKDRSRRRAVRERGFRWPRERLFLSSSAAYHRASLLMWFGARAEVQRSGEVTWWEDGADTAEWWPELEEPEMAGVSFCLGYPDEVARFTAQR